MAAFSGYIFNVNTTITGDSNKMQMDQYNTTTYQISEHLQFDRNCNEGRGHSHNSVCNVLQYH